MLQFIIGVGLGIFISLAAWRLRALSASGAAAAALTGALIFGLGGLPWAVMLLLFFISSTALSRAFGRRKRRLVEKFSKGSQRDWGQVFANGGLGALLVVIHTLLPGETWPWVAFAGSLAAVNADTWATELGVLNKSAPRLITTGQAVEMGTSGAISLVGSLAAAAGAGLLAFGAVLFSYPLGLASAARLPLFAAVLIGGFLGAAVDSLLGATLQGIYWCPTCLKETERHPVHLCGTPTHPRRGLNWLNNDLVNLVCAGVGAALAVIVFYVLTA
jgi:uncharacterized protein (TIGR00297 family)